MFKKFIIASVCLFSVICFGSCKDKVKAEIEPSEVNSSVPVAYDLIVKGDVVVDGNTIAVDFVAKNVEPLKGENKGEELRKILEEKLGLDVKYAVHVTGYLNIYGLKIDIDKDFSN